MYQKRIRVMAWILAVMMILPFFSGLNIVRAEGEEKVDAVLFEGEETGDSAKVEGEETDETEGKETDNAVEAEGEKTGDTVEAEGEKTGDTVEAEDTADAVESDGKESDDAVLAEDEEEPHFNEKLIHLENVLMTPHTGNDTVEARNEMAQMAIDQAIKALNGKELDYKVN